MKSRVAAVLLGVLATTSVVAQEYVIAPGSDVVGEVQIINAAYEDTFVKLARRYNVGPEDLKRANPGVDDWLPGEGTPIVIPSQYVLPDVPERCGLVLNIPEHRLYYFPECGGDRVITHPIGVGREGWNTPYGRTEVIRKQHLPTWYPPESVREEHAAAGDPLPSVVPPGPENPLGEHALYLGIAGYLIHGTNKPGGVGMRVSHGCIRMFPEDIEQLFGMVPVGTRVTLVNQPYKLGFGENGLYMEAHPPLFEESEEWTATELTRLYVAASERRQFQWQQQDWRQAETVMHMATGMPEFVSASGAIVLADSGE